MGFVRPVDLETFGFIYFFIIKDMDREKEDFSLDTRGACSSRRPNYTLQMDLSMFFLWNVRQASWISLTWNAVKAITSINQLEQRKQTKKLAKDKPNKKMPPNPRDYHMTSVSGEMLSVIYGGILTLQIQSQKLSETWDRVTLETDTTMQYTVCTHLVQSHTVISTDTHPHVVVQLRNPQMS